ncbi:MAG TPA: SLATT domain-containing protein [Aggregatilineales bacterium]|nr:SLATT domain-containing protein [Aggregatilineales bacterium]
MASNPQIDLAAKKAEEERQQHLPASKRQHDISSADTLLRVYLNKRIDGQLEFYKARVREFDTNTNFVVSLGALVMAASSIISAIGTTQNSAELALITALLPAMAALIAALRQLYQWEKQASLYRDASLGLQEARLLMPDWDQYDNRSAQVIYPRLVEAAEQVFVAEINQWGQIALGVDKEAEDSLQKELTALSDADKLNEPEDATFNDGGVG